MGFVKQFKKTEEQFAEVLKEFGEVMFSTEREDMNEHFDLICNTTIKLDVKAVKKIRRSDYAPNENFHYVELINVNGQRGWLYGESQFFAFELEEYWLVVGKEKLQEFIAEKLKNKERCSKPELHKIYSREGRNDAITLVKTLDLCYLSSYTFKKTNPTQS